NQLKRGARRPQDLPLHEIPRRLAGESIAGVLRRQARAIREVGLRWSFGQRAYPQPRGCPVS
ncbi:MAG: hypothetical protein RL077_3506, partial [Verrucomicrobiota bacterium]